MESENKIKWKDTLNLPRTNFPMKAQLSMKEPTILKFWDELDIYNKIIEKNRENELFILHDGPPYANGHIHLGHSLNKLLKDFVVKTNAMLGYNSPYVPGWDCHGLPIEIKVDKKLGSKKKDLSVPEIRQKCREYAENFIDIQREEFKRLGVFGDWRNPYKTIQPEYEAYIIDAFRSFVEKGNIVRKKRPVYWCTSCHTALAEAEVEYDNHTSPSIYVKFLLRELPAELSGYSGKKVFVLIWTTTPWTIPANLAVAVKEDYDYSLFEMNGELYIAAERLVEDIASKAGWEFKILKSFKGSVLKGLNTKHPLYDRDSLLITTDYVELDQGTGCVHTAPGHGEDDYRAGLEYGLDIYAPVGPTGLFDETTGKYERNHIFASNKTIVEDLRESNHLIHDEEIDHSYPHCWRCKNPVIFRATEQWFIAMDNAALRTKAMEELKKARWIPEWGEERIFNMIENRPDWCISRQRNWGVPLPVFFCNKCNESLVDPEIIKGIRDYFLKHGSDSWYTDDISNFLPRGASCGKCGSADFTRGADILDVWFESGASFGVLENYPGHKFPADLYLEGGDQYRGWFHSSLLVAVTHKGESPYKNVLTHGWALDHEGKAMSKSLGNVISPLDIIKEKGAEILRLWVAMVNYKEDVRLGSEVLSRVTESYRKIRNTWKFMLGVMADFNPDKDQVKDDQFGDLDLYILSKLEDLKTVIREAYRNYEFHTIFHAISNFFVVDLSSFYLSLIKDNVYCNGQDSPERKASQTAVFRLLLETALYLAPILSFTSEEVWEHMPHFEGKHKSIHLHNFPEMNQNVKEKSDRQRWDSLMVFRNSLLKEIETARNEKVIGDSLEAEIDLSLPEDMYRKILPDLDLLKSITGISGLNLSSGSGEKITVKKFTGKKCPRCWNWFKVEDGKTEDAPICPRCTGVVKEMELGIE